MKRSELQVGDKIRTKRDSLYKNVPIGSTGTISNVGGCFSPCDFHARTDFDDTNHCFSFDSIQVLRRG